MRRIILAFLAALLLLPGAAPASASGGDVLSAQSEALELDGLEDAAGDWLPGMELEAGLSLDEGLRSIVDTGSGELFGGVRKAVRSGVLLLAVVLLCGLAEGLYAGTGAGRAVDVVSIVGAMAVAAVAAAGGGGACRRGGGGPGGGTGGPSGGPGRGRRWRRRTPTP